jgi:hypothetical protein
VGFFWKRISYEGRKDTVTPTPKLFKNMAAMGCALSNRASRSLPMQKAREIFIALNGYWRGPIKW